MAEVKDYSAEALLAKEKEVELDTDDVKEERAKILAEYDKKKKEVNAKKKYETLLSYNTTFFPVKLD